MAIIKCKMCGGDMELSADQTYGTCEYCGSTMTLPKVDGEQRAATFNRGNHFRRIGEFDKALAIYERMVQEDDRDAEAHWCCALCRFGIEYVKDPASGDYLPTCHRASFDSFLEDVDYKAALQYADAVARKQYEKDGAKIAEVQRGILAISQKEQPFDVFLCYKESDDAGNRTVDSTLAQEIYYELTEQGRRVFFARITLEDKAGQQYEPYIFAALHSAKVMVVVGTKPEYLNAVWVKNEWSRYLALMKTDRKRLLIPCYRDMDPYDLPEQLSVLQAYDMAKIGFLQDLTRGIAKVLDAGRKPEPSQTASEGGAKLEALLKRGRMALEDEAWQNADGFFEQALNLDAECAEAYLGKLLAQWKAPSLAELVRRRVRQPEARYQQRTACQEETDRIREAQQRFAVDGYLEAEDIAERFQFDRTYPSAQPYRQDQLERETGNWAQNKLYQRAVAFAEGDLKQKLLDAEETVVAARRKSLEEAEAEEEANIRRIREAYRTHLDRVTAELEAEHADCLRRRDRDRQETQRREETERRQAEQQARRTARTKKIAILLGTILVVAVAAVLLVTQVVLPQRQYKAAEALLAQGDRAGAAMQFGAIAGYRDAWDRSTALWDTLTPRHTLAANTTCTVGLKEDGSITTTDYYEWYSDEAWSDLVSLSCQALYTLGLRADGTVVAGGYFSDFGHEAEGWSDIVAIDCSDENAVGLKADGTVVTTGEDENGPWDVSGWTGIIAVACTDDEAVGLRADGTVVSTGIYRDPLSQWSGITAIACGDYHVAGLKADGTVVAVGNNMAGQCDVTDWSGIAAIDCGGSYTVGLKADGTVVAVGDNSWGQCNVEKWTDVAAVCCGGGHTVGLKTNGAVVAAGYNEDGQCNVSYWNNVKIPAKLGTE